MINYLEIFPSTNLNFFNPILEHSNGNAFQRAQQKAVFAFYAKNKCFKALFEVLDYQNKSSYV